MSGKSKAKSKDKAKSQTQETPESTSTDITPELEQPPTPEEALIPEQPHELTEEPAPTPITTPTPTLDQLYQEILTLRQLVMEHSGMIVYLQQTIARKRKPVASNGKIQIKDKQTGAVYPSKNNVYQSLLKAGELKELVDKGLFGDVPEKNTFGWYVLVREWPDRFEEVHETQNT